MMLDERKIKILTAVIDDYIATAEPIGSRTIARKYRIGISPATIRNEMADLEELGYLSQPHISAGRIPSNKGYRFYVDFLLPSKKIDEHEQALICRLFKTRVNELEELVEQAARVISKLTSYTTITLGPQLETSRFKHIQLSRIEEKKALLIVITNYGTISHHIIEVPSNLNGSDFIRISNILNNNLSDKTISGLTNEAKDIIKNEGTLDEYTALDITKQIAKALGAAHKKGIIHRDIKPHNILISNEGRIVKVADFGIAKAVSSSTMTSTGSVIGSVHYFSPEQAKGKFVGKTTDLYSLGIVLYEMIIGRVPFRGDSPISIALQHINDEIEFTQEEKVAIPQSVRNIIKKLTSKASADRYQGADELIEDLPMPR